MNTTPTTSLPRQAITPGSISATDLKSAFEKAAKAGGNITAITEFQSSIIHSANYYSVCSNFASLEGLWSDRSADHSFGMLYCRNKLAAIVASVYSWEPYVRHNEQCQNSTHVTLEEFSQESWEGLLKEIHHTREACIRKDCRVVQPDLGNKNNEDAVWMTNYEFQRDYDNLVQKIKQMGKNFAPLRWVLLNAGYTTKEKVKEADNIIKEWGLRGPCADDIEEIKETFWEQTPTPNDDEEMAYLMIISDRLRLQDVDLRQLQRMIKTLMMRWDKTCFLSSLNHCTGDDGQNNVRKRARYIPNVAASLLAISANGRSSVRYTEDPRYVPPDRAVHGAPKKVKFSVEEDAAILRGLDLHSEKQDCWKQIKLGDPVLLRNRSNVQIKDRVRTLIRNGHLIEHAPLNLPFAEHP